MSGNKEIPAFPQIVEYDPRRGMLYEGMSLRDYFAIHIPGGEIADCVFRSLSKVAKAALVGRVCPERPNDKAEHGAVIAYQLDLFAWECEVRCAVRYKMADAMLAAREARS